MQLTCPVCGARHPIEAATNDEAAREVAKLATGMRSAGTGAVLYLGLFRPRKHALRWSRAAGLLRELSGAFHAGSIRRRGRDWPVTPEMWREAFETMLARRDEGRLTLPLRDHAYLFEVLAGLSDRVEAAEERAVEERRRTTPRRREGGDPQLERLDPARTREHLDKMRAAALGRPAGSTSEEQAT